MTKNNEERKGEIVIYGTDDGKSGIDVRLEDETVWLTQAQMARLFGKGRTTITEHLRNVFKEKELEEESVCRNFRHTGRWNSRPEYFSGVVRKYQTTLSMYKKCTSKFEKKPSWVKSEIPIFSVIIEYS